jgi:hypothetical protein
MHRDPAGTLRMFTVEHGGGPEGVLLVDATVVVLLLVGVLIVVLAAVAGALTVTVLVAPPHPAIAAEIAPATTSLRIQVLSIRWFMARLSQTGLTCSSAQRAITECCGGP